MNVKFVNFMMFLTVIVKKGHRPKIQSLYSNIVPSILTISIICFISKWVVFKNNIYFFSRSVILLSFNICFPGSMLIAISNGSSVTHNRNQIVQVSLLGMRFYNFLSVQYNTICNVDILRLINGLVTPEHFRPTRE